LTFPVRRWLYQSRGKWKKSGGRWGGRCRRGQFTRRKCLKNPALRYMTP